MINVKLFLIQLFATIAIALLNAIIIFSYYNFLLVDIITNFKFESITVYMIFVTLLMCSVIMNNLSVPYSDYNISDDESVEDVMRDELSALVLHIVQGFACTMILLILMIL